MIKAYDNGIKIYEGIENNIYFYPDSIISTYPKFEREKAVQYQRVMELKKNGLRICEISKVLGIPKGRISAWCIGRKPLSLKAKETALYKKWLPISINSKKFITVLDIFSWIFGDGHLRENGHFRLSGQRIDLRILGKNISNDLGLDYKIEYDPFKYGDVKTSPDTCSLTLKGEGSNIFGRILIMLGAPVNSKVKNAFKLPVWLLRSNLEVKRRFLEILFSNEITIRRLEKNNALPNFDLRMDKEKFSEGLLFFKQVKGLIKEFDIGTTGPRVKKYKNKNKATICLTISKNMFDLCKFYKTFNLIYAIKKQMRLDNLGIEINNKLKKHLQNLQDYKLAIQMNKFGYGRRRLSKILNKNTATISNWLYNDVKPLFIGKEDYIRKLIK